MKTAVATASDIIHSRTDDGYEAFLTYIGRSYGVCASENPPLFRTNASGLFSVFLDNLPDDARQHYTCNACRQFVERYGGLVTIAPDGETTPVFWSFCRRDVPVFFHPAVVALDRAVRDAKVTGVFFYDRQVWGQPVTGDWHHMAVMPDAAYSNALMTPAQHMAEKREDFKTLIAALHDFPMPVVKQAPSLLRSDTLYRSEKVPGVAEWLYKLQNSRQETKNAKLRHNMTWLAVAQAPAGFCHVRSTMIGTLLEDIAAGYSFEGIRERFSRKMNPLNYQRPQAAPTAGNIKQAEAVVSKLGIERALERRFARLEELPLIWKPQPPALPVNGNGVFSRLQPKSTDKPREIVTRPVVMTWEKFNREVLPNAAAIEFLTGHDQKPYAAILTAVHEDAPPILQWDREERRNPFSWYVYPRGSFPQDWNLPINTYVPVTGICLQPSMWQPGFYHHGMSVFLILKGARDDDASELCLFPEILRNDLHGIRATIEAHSKSGKLSGQDAATACGIRLQSGKPMSITLLVTTDIGKQVYVIDRWD